MTLRTTPYRRAATLVFWAVLLQWGVAFSARGQSALDGFDPHANAAIRAIALQSDGKALIGGDFTQLAPNGGAAVARDHLARLNPDGTVDASFIANVNGIVRAIVVQPNGRILIGGDFTLINKTIRNHIARLDSSGAVDSFDPNADDIVQAIALQQFNGQVIFGGDFKSIAPNGASAVKRPYIARVSATGALDATFGVDVDNFVLTIALEGDNILMGGVFTTINGTKRNHIARLRLDSSLDTGFDPNASATVRAITVGSGAIFVGGDFTGLSPSVGSPAARRALARLNSDGSVESHFNANGNGIVDAIAIDAENRLLVGGEFGLMGGQARNRIARLDSGSGVADTFDPNANSLVTCIALQQDRKVLAGGLFTSLLPDSSSTAVTRTFIARLEIDGRADRTVDLGTDLAAGEVRCTAVQTDGKILIGGLFPIFDDVHILRLNTDGTLDGTFTGNNDPDNDVEVIAVQADGKILIGGTFTNFGVPFIPRNHIARLNQDGTLDMSFDPNTNGTTIETIVVQPDNKILISGDFSALSPNGGPTFVAQHIARLNPDGSLDFHFNSNANAPIVSMALQRDGKIVVGGGFTNLANSIGHSYFGRLNSDGSLDPNFTLANFDVFSVAVQEDGKILVGGLFTTIGTTPRNRMARVNPDGTVDTAFIPNASFDVRSIVVQADGKILVGGDFTNIGGQPRSFIARLDRTTGAADSFNPNVTGNILLVNEVRSLALQQDGKVLVGGFFNNVGGQTRLNFARLSNDTAALQNVVVAPTAVTFTHAGASPQFRRVTFESSPDDVNFTLLGNATFSGGNWTLGGLTFPTGQNLIVRTRGFYGSGESNGSESALGTRQNALFPGNFVIGDRNAIVGQRVVFWGAHWAKSNSLSGGLVPESFKGFANVTSTVPAACGGTWSSDPGNGAGAPNGLPASITVIVASSITQSGGTISGDVAQTAVVQPDPGYDDDPGHPGTGTVVSVSCDGP